MRHGPAGSAGGGRQGARGACLQARAGGVRGARVRGAAAGRAVGGQEGDQAVGPARGHSPAQASRLRASRAHTPPARRCFVPPRTRAPPLAGPEPGRELVGEGAWGGLSFSTSHRGKLGLTPLPARPLRLLPSVLQIPLGTLAHPAFLPSLLPWASALLRGWAPSRSSSHSYFQEGGVWVEGFLQTNPRLRSERGPGWGEADRLRKVPGRRRVRVPGVWPGLPRPVPGSCFSCQHRLRAQSSPISISLKRCFTGWGGTQSHAPLASQHRG